MEGATGATFGKYRIVRKIGEGAFGSVYEAQLPGPMGFAKRVAIKRIRPNVVEDDPKFVQSMINEARIGGLLHHANIVDIFEFGQETGHYYLAMELVDGATLNGILRLCRKRRVLLPRFAVVDIAIQVCRGLHYAHTFREPGGDRLDLIHRDLKPSNVMVDREGTAKICDFGIAKAASNLYKTTAEGFVKGTPRYMSPEQITGEGELSPRSDVFSLGVVLYEVITGGTLFAADSLVSLMHSILSADLGEKLTRAENAFPGSASVLERALARDPAERFEGARAMGDALRELGRTYPPEADMAEVIGRLMGSLDRTETREIVDSKDLSVDGTAGGETGLTSAELGKLSDETPIPPPEPTSAGWDRFSSVFQTDPAVSLEDLSSSTETTAGEPTEALMSAPRLDPEDPEPSTDISWSTEEREAVGGGRKWGLIALVGVVGLLLLVGIGYAGARLWGGVESGIESGTAAQTEPEAPTEPESEAVAEPVHTAGALPVASGVEAEAEAEPEPDADGRPAASETEIEPEVDEAAERRREERRQKRKEREAAEAAEAAAAAAASESLDAGTVSISSRPWSVVYVDGVSLGNRSVLRSHSLDGGPHEIRLVCTERDNQDKTFRVDIDGDHVNLGCWDFDTMRKCEL